MIKYKAELLRLMGMIDNCKLLINDPVVIVDKYGEYLEKFRYERAKEPEDYLELGIKTDKVVKFGDRPKALTIYFPEEFGVVVNIVSMLLDMGISRLGIGKKEKSATTKGMLRTLRLFTEKVMPELDSKKAEIDIELTLSEKIIKDIIKNPEILYDKYIYAMLETIVYKIEDREFILMEHSVNEFRQRFIFAEEV